MDYGNSGPLAPYREGTAVRAAFVEAVRKTPVKTACIEALKNPDTPVEWKELAKQILRFYAEQVADSEDVTRLWVVESRLATVWEGKDLLVTKADGQGIEKLHVQIGSGPLAGVILEN